MYHHQTTVDLRQTEFYLRQTAVYIRQTTNDLRQTAYLRQTAVYLCQTAVNLRQTAVYLHLTYKEERKKLWLIALFRGQLGKYLFSICNIYAPHVRAWICPKSMLLQARHRYIHESIEK